MNSLNNSDRIVEIMIVDDEPTNLLLLNMMLSKAGYQTSQAVDGNQAYFAACQKQPDLILLDIQMPQIDGYETCIMLKKNLLTKDIPVVFISALDGGNDIAQGFLVGGADYITKPFKREEVLFRIKNQLILASNRKKMNQQISEQLIFQHNLLDSIPNPIFFKDIDGKYLGCNLAFELCFDLKSEQIVGKTSHSLTQDVISKTAYEFCQNFQEIESATPDSDGQFFNIEAKVQFADGLVHNTITSKTVFFNLESNLHYIIYVITDITGIMALEEKLRRSQKMEAIGVLSAGIAHEINSPMQYILDNTRFLEDGIKDLLNLLDVLKHNNLVGETADSVRINELIKGMDIDFLKSEIPQAISENILGISKVRNIISALKEFSFPRGFVFFDTDVNRAIESIVLITGNTWKQHAKLEKHLDPNLPLLPCYADELNQVFINLIVNAVDAIMEQSDRDGLIVITTSLVDNCVHISFADNGAGIADQIKDRIFEPFFTTKEVGRGTGQGLSIVYDIVYNLHKGSIEVNSTVGKGTEFIIKLPLNIEGDNA